MTSELPELKLFPAAWAAQVQSRLEAAAPQRWLQRLWAQDASIWTDDPAAQRVIRQRLGWLTIAPTMEARADDIRSFAEHVSRAGFSHAVVLGMGGSSLFADVGRGLFGAPGAGIELSVLDSTDPTLIQAVASRTPLDRTLFIISSKSGSTVEVTSLFDYFYDQALMIHPRHAGEQFVVITDQGTPLEHLAASRRVLRAFVHGPGCGQEVGGRFSALTYFGLVPAALLGADPSILLARAQAMLEACGPTAGWQDNSAAQLGLALADAALRGRSKVTLFSAPELAPVEAWLEQLLAESTGKSGQGLIPIVGEPPPGACDLSDRIFVALRCRADADADLDLRLEQLAQDGHPVIRVTWRDRFDVAAEAVRWFIATALLGAALRINPFDEPNVEESKERTKALLAAYLRTGEWPVETPAAAAAGLEVHGAQVRMVRELLAQLDSRDYLAILSYVPRTPELDQAVTALRRRLAAMTRSATLLNQGPRYLHSVGQLHKGGPDRAGFLCLTADDPIDVPIPNRGYSFGVLKHAQALGDVTALRARGRRVVRVHLGAKPLAALSRMTEELLA